MTKNLFFAWGLGSVQLVMVQVGLGPGVEPVFRSRAGPKYPLTQPMNTPILKPAPFDDWIGMFAWGKEKSLQPVG